MTLKTWENRLQKLLIIGPPMFFSVLPKTARSAQAVENPYSFFNVSYTWYKSLPLGYHWIKKIGMLLHNRFLSTLNGISPLWMENFLSKQWILNDIYRKGSGDFFNYRFQSGNDCLALKSFCRIVLLRNKNDEKNAAEKKCKWYFLHLFDWTFDIRLTEQRGNFEFGSL